MWHVCWLMLQMQSNTYYPTYAATQDYIIINIKKKVKENISQPHSSSCLCHLLKLADCHREVKAETLYTRPLLVHMIRYSRSYTLTTFLHDYTSPIC